MPSSRKGMHNPGACVPQAAEKPVEVGVKKDQYKWATG